ncbi:helix-turn-helix domain-containing protein [Patescibacteria group bacterium]|nr:helix-turn-helix domain-containing protein [Patescibacteria group bacterium]
MINWKFDIEDQLESYLFCLEGIGKSFFQHHRFYLLPTLPEKFQDRVVFLPKTSYLNRHKSLEKPANSFKPTIREKEKILKLASYIYKKRKTNLKKLESDFFKSIGEICPRLEKLFPITRKIDITVSPSLFGSVRSYRFESSKIIVKPRFDRQIQNVYKLLVHALVHFMYFDTETLCIKSPLWKEKQNLTNKFYKQLNFDNFLDNSKGMLDYLTYNHCGKLAEQSASYFKWLNIPIKNKAGSNINTQNFTKSECDVLSLLNQKKGQIVDIEEIANSLWKEKIDEKFSLYAISKTMQRLRSKVKKSTGYNLIHCQRGKGYILYD